MVANPLAGWPPVLVKPRRSWSSGLQSMPLVKAKTSISCPGVLLSLLTHKTELIVRGVYGASKTQCIALLAAFFALRGHHVYYASRENTTAAFVQELLPRAPEEAWPIAIRLLSQPQARTSESTDLDARDTDKNQQIWNAKLVLATTGLHLAQFRQQHRPLAKAVDYADLFITTKHSKKLLSVIWLSLGRSPASVQCSALVTSSKPLGALAPVPVTLHVRCVLSRINLRLAFGLLASRAFPRQSLP